MVEQNDFDPVVEDLLAAEDEDGLADLASIVIHDIKPEELEKLRSLLMGDPYELQRRLEIAARSLIPSKHIYQITDPLI